MKNKFCLSISLCFLCGVNIYGYSKKSEYLKTINQNQKIDKEDYMAKMTPLTILN